MIKTKDKIGSLRIETIKRPYTISLEIQFPLCTLQQVCKFLKENKVITESLIMTNLGMDRATLTLHLLMEKQNAESIIQSLATIPFVLRMGKADLQLKMN